MTAPADLVRLAGRDLPASAKINLALHVTGQRADGYHTLSSLVAFAEAGDTLSVAAADSDRFELSGPFAAALAACPAADNIVLKALAAARGLAARAGHDVGPLAIHLSKRLPVASGIGGGSADAAALLRLFTEAMPALAVELRAAGLRLGADVPMCLDGVPAVVEGIGEHSQPLARFPAIDCLLINPGVSVSTPDVFRRLQERTNPPLPAVPAEGFSTLAELVDYLRKTRNDLQGPAVALAPSIALVAGALETAGAQFTRMSGSGATVFGLFDSADEAKAAAAEIGTAHPDWWVAATRLKPAGSLKDIR
jgi:4-diphosphocytidyl-2-C-methyl-D-erythritol kinase